MASLNDILGFRPPLVILPEQVRKVLHQRGLTSIRQSHYGMGRECGHKLSLVPKGLQETSSMQALFGSVFHELVQRPEEARERQADESFYQDMFRLVRAKDANTAYLYRGAPVTWPNLKRFAFMFSTAETIYIRLGELAHRVYQDITALGIKIEAQEKHLSVIDGGLRYPIRRHGTLDLRARMGGALAHGDFKTTGLWDPFLKDKGSLKAQSISQLDLQYHSQLRDYDWLQWLLTGEVAEYHFIVLPINLVPYADIKRRSDRRGETIQIASSLGLRGIQSYQQDYINFFSSWTAAEPPRTYPTNWGTLACPTCPFWRACQGDLNSSIQASEFDAEELDYLRA